MNAGSISPLEAIRIALITPGSAVGKASASVNSACCCGDNGLGGFGGAFSAARGAAACGPAGVSDVGSWVCSSNNGDTGDTVWNSDSLEELVLTVSV